MLPTLNYQIITIDGGNFEANLAVTIICNLKSMEQAAAVSSGQQWSAVVGSGSTDILLQFASEFTLELIEYVQ